MTKISVIIPIFNTDKYLRRCIDSVLDQDFADYEITCNGTAKTSITLEATKRLYVKSITLVFVEEGDYTVTCAENLENGYVQEITFPEIVNGNYNNYYARINLKGKVVVQGSNTSVSNGVLTNISNAVQLIHFEVPSINSDQLCYILLANGDVYYYRIGDVDDGKLAATKVDGISNVKRLFIYYHEKNTHELVAIDKDNTLISLKKESV